MKCFPLNLFFVFERGKHRPGYSFVKQLVLSVGETYEIKHIFFQGSETRREKVDLRAVPNLEGWRAVVLALGAKYLGTP